MWVDGIGNTPADSPAVSGGVVLVTYYAVYTLKRVTNPSKAFLLERENQSSMQVERETVIETVVSVVGVGLFIGMLVLIGLEFNQNGLTDTGAFAIISAIVLFILLMTGVGYWLSAREN